MEDTATDSENVEQFNIFGSWPKLEPWEHDLKDDAKVKQHREKYAALLKRWKALSKPERQRLHASAVEQSLDGPLRFYRENASSIDEPVYGVLLDIEDQLPE